MATARTPLLHWHAAHGARFVERDGWQVVVDYGDVQKEVDAVKTGLALADISSFAKVCFHGSGVPELTRNLVPNGIAMHVRDVVRLANVEALACRLTEDQLLILSLASANRQSAIGDRQSAIHQDVTSAYAGFWLIGPRFEELLRNLTHFDVRPRSFPLNSCAETSLAGVEALLVRTAELSVPAVLVYVGWDVGEYGWERIMDSGRAAGIVTVGEEALGALGVGAKRKQPHLN